MQISFSSFPETHEGQARHPPHRAPVGSAAPPVPVIPFNVLIRCSTASDVGMLVQISGMDFAGLKTLVAENTPQERGIGLTPQQDDVIDCTARARDRLASGRPMYDDFGQHWIKCGRNDLALGDA